MLEALEEHTRGRQRQDVQVLCPGAGLGRLVWEVAQRGYSCQGRWSAPVREFGLTVGGWRGLVNRERIVALHAVRIERYAERLRVGGLHVVAPLHSHDV